MSQLTSCRKCRRCWAGLAEAHCSTCCEHFSSVSAFDRHRQNGECLDPMTAHLFPRDRAYGRIWVTTDSDGDKWWEKKEPDQLI